MVEHHGDPDVDEHVEVVLGQAVDHAQRLDRHAEAELVIGHAGVEQGGGHRGDEVGVGGLLAGELDVELRQLAGHPVLPGHDLLAGAAEHPAADRQRQAGLLERLDAAVVLEDAELGMVPAKKWLYRNGPATLDGDDRLVLELDLAALPGTGNRGGEVVPAAVAGTLHVVDERPLAAPGRLEPAQFDIGRL